MRHNFVRFSLLVLMAFAAISYDIPTGWVVAGDKPYCYDMGTDIGAGQNGKNAATIKSVKRHIEGFGTLMQNFTPDKYKGKRVKLTGYVKAQDVDDWSGLWMRVDGKKINPVTGKHSRTVLAFDNMCYRPIKGTRDFTKYEIVLDVPDSATNIAYGALLHGTGQIWFDNLKFDIVGNDTPVTSSKLNEPTNLDFDK